ncbi:MAG: hypothetical protein CMJ24_04130 [Phycisphaerae bacterium]|nr:hypothetical protein [Phycisphaerae bacterium]
MLTAAGMLEASLGTWMVSAQSGAAMARIELRRRGFMCGSSRGGEMALMGFKIKYGSVERPFLPAKVKKWSHSI